MTPSPGMSNRLVIMLIFPYTFAPTTDIAAVTQDHLVFPKGRLGNVSYTAGRLPSPASGRAGWAVGAQRRETNPHRMGVRAVATTPLGSVYRHRPIWWYVNTYPPIARVS